MSQSILKQAGASSPTEPRSVQLGGVSHAEGAAVPAHEPAVSGATAQGAQLRGGGASGRGGGAGRSAGLSGTMSALTPSWDEHNLKAEAKQLLGFSGAVQQQMDLYGDGHPQGGKIAVSFAESCTALAKKCLAQNMLRTSRELLGQALHYLRCNHSMLVFGDHQRVLAETHNNLGCLENKRGNLEPALKHLLAAVEIEADLEWEVGHAATLLNACSTMSLLNRHPEALAFAKQAVDMLVSVDQKNWHALVADRDSEAGELLPVAFNNLGLEFEFAGDRAQSQQAYDYAVTLATRRWGLEDARTVSIMEAASDADQGLPLGQFRAPKKLKPPPRSSLQESLAVVRHKPRPRVEDAKQLALLRLTGKKGVPKLREKDLAVVYAEVNDPISRKQDQRPGFHSPRFWATKDGMEPRRASSFLKDTKQVGLELSRQGGAGQFPSSTQQTSWGESRVRWVDLPESDLSRIDGSVPSRSRVFSETRPNAALAAARQIQQKRAELRGKFPADRSVFTKALVLRESLRGGLHSLPELR